jgi:hypothetical protein
MKSPGEVMPGFIRVGHKWTSDVWWSAVRCRLGRFGQHSRVAPGLYALGRPDSGSPVLVTASYRLSFDLLRRDMGGIDCWILVLDTRGLGVASAAASGLFGTDELVTRITASRLARVVTHRALIIPARASGVIDTGLVAASTGFEARIGPRRTSEIRSFLAGREPAKHRDSGVLDTLVLTPVELGRSLLWYPGFAFAALLYAGLGPGGVTIDRAFAGSWPLLLLGLSSIVCGSLLGPVLSAVAPRVPPWAFGALAGCAATAALLEGARLASFMDSWLAGACWIFFPCAAALRSVQFEKALPEEARSAVPVRHSFLLPLGAGAGVLVIAALVLSKLGQWRPGP